MTIDQLFRRTRSRRRGGAVSPAPATEVVEPTTLLISGDPRDHARARGGYVIGLINQMKRDRESSWPKIREEWLVRPGHPIQHTHAPQDAQVIE